MQISAATVEGSRVPTWQESMQLACDWTIDRSMIDSKEAPFNDSRFVAIDDVVAY